ncbi:fat-like cadherin-related tumor suppressor homolog isoform X2 [Centruroides sculpturatus]|uniref:fat-like cadherin-related tumor suppressor homolog isoform X2 n=1 Tax=Centruroides sculpturatus TaxID=218467 RepID=UPI000C6E5DDA|nr:fat-like cadherin-related tumor suppressor homolog isoform X2 [Centruroides sculpturatus]
MCVPDSSPLGYSCDCPPEKSGPLCDWEKEILCEESSCYEEKKPISFGGKSYACYILAASIDRHLSVVLRIRTKQSTGNLMFAAGVQDYSILEIENGLIRYRLDCGSGEGVIRVERAPVNDGNWHEIRLERRGNTAELVVDRRHRASGTSPGFYEVLNLDGSDVYFGAEVRSAGYADVRMGFVGCMDEILINGISLPLHVTAGNPVATLRRFVNVDFHCRTLFDPGVCGSQPCQNGGTCQPREDSFTCQCLPRFLGTFCEIDTNPCGSNPCLNGGTCRNLNGNFQCHCPPGLSGKRCDYGRYCNPNPCRNNGVCEEGTANPICKCPGFHGELCQYDVDECQNNPCASGATCVNVHGAFHCRCPPNMTGSLCTEHIYVTSVTSSSWNTTIEEIVGIALVIFIIFLLALMLVCCWRYRYKRYRQRPNNQNVDLPGRNEFLLKNPVGEKENLQRYNKITNLEVTTNFATPPLPPRPSSYTPTTQESLTTLNNFDRVRSYGSAADDLDHVPRYAGDVQHNVNRTLPVSIAPNLPPLPSSNSASDSESLRKNNWERDNSNLNDKVFEDKIQIDLVKPKCKVLSALHPTPAVPSRGPSSLGVSSAAATNSADDLPDLHWDYSDWTADSGRRDASHRRRSQDSRADSRRLRLPPPAAGGKSPVDPPRPPDSPPETEDPDLPDSYVGDSEYNDEEADAVRTTAAPDFRRLLSDLEFADDGVDTPSPSPDKYRSHPDRYLPAHFPSSDTSPDSSLRPGDEDEVVPYGFPCQGRRTFHPETENGDPASALDSLSLSVGGYASTDASYSDVSGAVCEIDDSDADCEAAGRRMPRLFRDRTTSTAV